VGPIGRIAVPLTIAPLARRGLSRAGVLATFVTSAFIHL
jgi:hypothetical protein